MNEGARRSRTCRLRCVSAGDRKLLETPICSLRLRRKGKVSNVTEVSVRRGLAKIAARTDRVARRKGMVLLVRCSICESLGLRIPGVTGMGGFETTLPR